MNLIRRIAARAEQILALRADSGPYRFLVRKWDGITDIDLAVRVLGTEFFKRELDCLPLPLGSVRSALVIAPHQDDETIGAGGTMLLAAERGTKLDVLFLTDGGQPNSPYPLDESVRIRDAEATEVCTIIGATSHHLGISNYTPKPTIADVRQIGTLIQELAPEVILIPWLLDWPAKHRLANHLLYLAHCIAPLPKCEIWGYQVHNTLYPNGYVDISAVSCRKRELLLRYRSQNDHHRRYDHMAMGMSAWNARFLSAEAEAGKEHYVEVFFALPSEAHFRLIERFYFRDFAVTYRAEQKVVDAARSIHAQVMDMKKCKR